MVICRANFRHFIISMVEVRGFEVIMANIFRKYINSPI